jgi:predicted lipoprotein with Yx(FWY)xxD motif
MAMTGSKQPKRWRASGLAAMVGTALLVAACGSSSSSTPNAGAPASAATSSTPSSAGAAVGTAQGSAGTYLTGNSGRALYLWAADTGGKSSCSGACAKTWVPLTTTGAPHASGGANAADLGTITRSDGAKQVTYKGHPLYYYAPDTAAGMTTGQGTNSFGAKWWLVSPAGAPITSQSSSSKPSGSSSSGSSAGSYGGSSGGSSSGSSSGWG